MAESENLAAVGQLNKTTSSDREAIEDGVSPVINTSEREVVSPDSVDISTLKEYTSPELNKTTSNDGDSIKAEVSPIVEKVAQNVESADSFDVSALKEGTILTKVRTAGWRYPRHFFVDQDGLKLQYKGSQKGQCLKCYMGHRPDQSKISLKDVEEIREGARFGLILDPFHRQDEEARCFSLVVGAQSKVLDLIAPSQDSKAAWVKGLKYLINQAKLNEQECAWLGEKFSDADKNGNGVLDLPEIVTLLQKLSFNPFKTTATVKLLTKKTQMDRKDFVEFYRKISQRQEILDIFQQFSSGSDYMNAAGLVNFFATEQKETIADEDAAKLIEVNEPCPVLKNQLLLSFAGFQAFMASETMNIKKPICRKVYQDMTQPLSHYFINSSHNTYLEKHQLHGQSSVEQYIRVLRHRCRCVELDVWDGDDGEPIIYHGYTWTTKILFSDALKGIEEYAFKKSDYPVILSIENHCSIAQQRKMAEYLRATFKDKLYTEPLGDDVTELPSPEALKHKVLVKGKKLPVVTDETDGGGRDSSSDEDEAAAIDDKAVQEEVKKRKETATERKHALATELSDCVVIFRSAGFKSFENSAAKKDHFAYISSLDESKAGKLSEKKAVDFVRHNVTQTTRIYPAGSRTNSSNYDPVPMWNVGCQVVALNFQTRDDPLLFNYGRFEDNGACGYVLKPEFLRSTESKFDHNQKLPKEWTRSMTIRVVSGYVLPKKPGDANTSILDPYVVVEIKGVEADKKSHRTKTINDNGFHPVWDETLPTFQVSCPELAIVMFRVIDYEPNRSDVTIATYSLPFRCLQSGYRMVALRDIDGNVIGPTSLFVHVTISD